MTRREKKSRHHHHCQLQQSQSNKNNNNNNKRRLTDMKRCLQNIKNSTLKLLNDYSLQEIGTDWPKVRNRNVMIREHGSHRWISIAACVHNNDDNKDHATQNCQRLAFHCILYLLPPPPDRGPWVFALCANLAFLEMEDDLNHF